MGALKDDQPQFVELSDAERQKAAEDYARIWGDLPEDDDEEGDGAGAETGGEVTDS